MKNLRCVDCKYFNIVSGSINGNNKKIIKLRFNKCLINGNTFTQLYIERYHQCEFLNIDGSLNEKGKKTLLEVSL